MEHRFEEVDYIGIMMKRGNPYIDDYTALRARTKVKASVILNEAYDISKPGLYIVKLDTALHDVQEMSDDFVPTKLGRFNPISISTDAIVFIVLEDLYD